MHSAVDLAFADAVESGRLDLPLPGGGRTGERWAVLAELAGEDLSLARLAEGHADALAILAELGAGAPAPGSRWGRAAHVGDVVHGRAELHIPVSSKTAPAATFLKLTSADVNHSFWIPQLGGKTDLIANHVNTMWLDPEKPGLYVGQCA